MTIGSLPLRVLWKSDWRSSEGAAAHYGVPARFRFVTPDAAITSGIADGF
jgi:hypothetical protein